MNLSERSKLSLCQFLCLLPQEELLTMLMKHGSQQEELLTILMEHGSQPVALAGPVRQYVLAASASEIASLFDELLRTASTVRNSIPSPKYCYDERWGDLMGCLEIDGYVQEKDEYDRLIPKLVPIDPTIDGQEPLEDDLTKELKASGLPTIDGILRCLENSTNAFRSTQNPDFNGSLNNSRVAMESIARDIAGLAINGNEYDPSKWGKILAALKKNELLTKDQEEGLAGVYRFLSPGCHRPQAMTEREYVRLARHLTVSMAFFLLRTRGR